MDVEYFRISTFADLTVVYVCVWLFILLAVSLAVKKRPQWGTNYQSLATQSAIVQLVLQPVAFSDSELAEAYHGSSEIM